MTVSKRTRFEVLKRDNHTCRYCGAKAPDVKLHIDHVNPVSLGGSDFPDNLVTACVDCNLGKSSIMPGQSTVSDVSQDAMRWASAMKRAAEIQTENDHRQRELLHELKTQMTNHGWGLWNCGDVPLVEFLPHDWVESTYQFVQLGVPPEALLEYIEMACKKPGIYGRDRFRYFCGIVWTRVREQQEIAKSLLATEDAL